MLHKSYKLITLTPVVSANAIYTSGDQVGGITRIPEAVLSDGGTALLQSLCLIDKAVQKAALTLYFFDDYPTIASSDNAAFDLTDAQAVTSLIGHVLIPAANYQDSSSNTECTVTGIGLMLRSNAGKNSVALPSGATKRDLWCVLKTTGTPTYTSTSDLVLKLGLEQH